MGHQALVALLLEFHSLLVTFHNMLIFLGKEWLAPCPTPKLEDHHLLAVHD